MRVVIAAVVVSMLCLGGIRAGERPAGPPANPKPLLGQIIIDPENPSYLVYNRDANGDGQLAPFFLIGPGDPEGFLYLDRWQRGDPARC